ncbi:MAG: leucine-rich repeat domain-containing protein [Bacteroidota bacterium]|nr:leucine-rich repeat domain-containing protein [Bacteroidota bacterium]
MNQLRYFALIILTMLVFGSAENFAQSSDSLNTHMIMCTSIEDAMKSPEKVFKLDLHKKKLKEIPAEVFQLTNLTELDLSRNKIKTIPAEISKLKMLKKIDISRNNLETLPSEIGLLIKLKVLIANQNDLISLPAEIGKLENLEVLDLWGNNLSVFPDEMEHLKKLKLMDLRVISLNDAAQDRISNMLPNTKIHFSPSCNCK